MGRQRGGGAFAVCTGNGDDGRRAHLKEQFDLRSDERFALLCHLNKTIVGRDGGVDDDDIRRAEVVFSMFAEAILNRQSLERFEGTGKLIRSGQIGNKDFCACLCGEQGGILAAAKTAQSHYNDTLIAKEAFIHRLP